MDNILWQLYIEPNINVQSYWLQVPCVRVKILISCTYIDYRSCVSQHPGLFPLHFNAAYQPHNSNSLFSQLRQCYLCKAYHWPGLAIMVGSISRQSVYPCVLCDFRPFVVDRDVLVNSSLGLPHSATTF